MSKDIINKRIVIEVYGGVASVVSTYKDVEILIKDYDNKLQYRNIGGLNTESEEIK